MFIFLILFIGCGPVNQDNILEVDNTLNLMDELVDKIEFNYQVASDGYLEEISSYEKVIDSNMRVKLELLKGVDPSVLSVDVIQSVYFKAEVQKKELATKRKNTRLRLEASLKNFSDYRRVSRLLREYLEISSRANPSAVLGSD